MSRRIERVVPESVRIVREPVMPAQDGPVPALRFGDGGAIFRFGDGGGVFRFGDGGAVFRFGDNAVTFRD